MTRLLWRIVARAAAALVLVAGLGLAAGTGHASDGGGDDGRDDFRKLFVSINTGPLCWEKPNPQETCRVTVTLSQPVRVPVTVTLDTVDGTATAPADYAPLSGVRVTVPAGAVALDIPLRVTDDNLPEPDEWFLATISAASAGGIGTGRAVVTIRDGAPPDA